MYEAHIFGPMYVNAVVGVLQAPIHFELLAEVLSIYLNVLVIFVQRAFVTNRLHYLFLNNTGGYKFYLLFYHCR